jgi:hypothetical protein
MRLPREIRPRDYGSAARAFLHTYLIDSIAARQLLQTRTSYWITIQFITHVSGLLITRLRQDNFAARPSSTAVYPSVLMYPLINS